MKLSIDGIKDKTAWEEAGIKLPAYDVRKVAEDTKASPEWVHFGIGNIFRIFIGGIADSLIEHKRRQDAYEQGENERLMGDIRRLSEAARRTAAWADRVEGEKIGDIPDRDKYMMGGRAYIGEQSRKMQQRRKNIERPL